MWFVATLEHCSWEQCTPVLIHWYFSWPVPVIQAQFLQGDIICIQRKVAQDEVTEMKLNHPTVKSFLEYIQNSKIVNFRPLDNPKVSMRGLFHVCTYRSYS